MQVGEASANCRGPRSYARLADRANSAVSLAIGPQTTMRTSGLCSICLVLFTRCLGQIGHDDGIPLFAHVRFGWNKLWSFHGWRN